MKSILHNRILQHFSFWVFCMLFFFFAYREVESVRTSLIVTAVSFPYYILFVYVQLYFLIPRFLLKKKLTLYLVSTIILAKIAVNVSLVTYNLIVIPLRTSLPPLPKWYMLWTLTPNQVYPFTSMLSFCAMAVCCKLIKKWFHEHERNQRIEQEKMVMELEMLKAQVHPHFLFNTLNNLYSLTLTRSDDAPLVVTHLSGLLRYMLYECNEKEVPLNKEIAALKKYVELEKLRYSNRLDISFSSSGQTQGVMIAPLLLLPFVENSFKHGVSEQLDQCWINLHLHAENGVFTFNLSNSCSKEKISSFGGGIGLQNIQKRLELIYPKVYNLSISQQEEIYAVKLTMQLSPQQEPAPGIKLDFINPLSIAVI